MPSRAQEFPVIAPDLGLVTGVPYHAIPDKGWSAVLNMRFRLGNAQKVPGFVKVQAAALDSAVMGLYNYTTTTSFNFWIAATLHKVYKMGPTDATFVDISGGNDLGGVNNLDLVSMINYKDQLIVTNGRTAPWQTTVSAGGTISNIAALGGSPPSAKGVTVFQNHVVLWDINPYSATPSHQTFQWSDLGTSTVWTPSSSNEAGSLALVDEPSKILTCVRMRDSLMVYKKDAVYLVDYTGFPFTMSERRLMSGAGPVNQWAVVNVKDAHYILSTDKNVYRLTLFGPEDVAQQSRFGIFNDIAWGAIDSVFCFLNDGDNEVYFCFPSGSNSLISLGYILEYLESKWGRRDFGGVNGNVTCFSQPNDVQLLNALRWQDVTTAWSSQTATWAGTQTAKGAPIALMGDSNGFVYQFTTGQVDADTGAMTVQADTKYHNFGGLKNSRLRRLGLQYNAQAGTTLSVYVLTTQNPGITPTVNGPYTIVLDGSGHQWLDVDLTARYHAFRFYNNTLGQTFTLTGYNPVAYVREVSGPAEEVT